MKFEHAELSNGLQIVAECNPEALSSAVGFFVRAGSRDEAAEVAGVSHFLEHMAFKGNEVRSADDVNRLFDEIGAKYNAYTTEEHTVYHAAVLPEYMPQTIDLLSGLIRPSLRLDDFEMEKKVILEEISMYADSPVWTAYERAMRIHFATHPLGNSVLGTSSTVSQLSAEQMRAYHASRYCPGNIFVAASGKIDWKELVDLVEQSCGAWKPYAATRELAKHCQRGVSELICEEKFVQECLFLVASAPPADDALRFSAEVLANIVGDDTGSRLHWALTDPGKVENVDFQYHEFEGAGAYLCSANCEPEQAEENLATIREILREVSQKGITLEELAQAKNKLGTRIVLGAERPQNRLSSLGYNWSYRREYRTVQEDLDDLNVVTMDSVRAVLDAYPLEDLSIVCLGPLAKMNGLTPA